MFAKRRANGKVAYHATFVYQGRQIQELVGSDKREAERVEKQRKREVREGTYNPGQRTGAMSVAAYSEQWGNARNNRTANDDRQRLRDHFVSHVGPKIRMHEFGEAEALRFVQSLAERVAKGEISERTARHVRGVVRTMFRDARLEGVASVDPFIALPRKLLPKPPRRPRNVYTKDEIKELLNNATISDSVRVLLALMLYTGMREGEACGRRWRDLDRGARPLASLHVATQYDGDPLKTDNARKVPVHPELERILTWWFDEGFKIAFRRCPAADDFIVPNRNSRVAGDGPHTKSSAYKAMRRACDVAKVRFEGCHLTRHTMITWARRGGAPADVLESVTHNASGAIIDQYTHWDWEPLCKAVACIDYGTAAKLEHDASGTAVVPLPEPDAAAPKYGAAYGVPARTGQNHGNFRWRRRESNTSEKWRTSGNPWESTGPDWNRRGVDFPRIRTGSCRA